MGPDTAIGTVALTVSDVDRSRAFYEKALGLVALGTALDGSLELGGVDTVPLLALTADPAAAPLNPHNTGLFHFAMLLPSRRELAGALLRLLSARVRLSGASDHLVSEALYLNDPDGNGIEIYRDRPRSQWQPGSGGSVLEMATLPLDLEDLAGELSGPGDVPDGPVPTGTTIGHVHLQVAELVETERFYADLLGFDVTVRGYPGALFVSAGGYHHHIGLNTWNSRGGQAPTPPALGLGFFEVRVGDAAGLAAVRTRVQDAGLDIEPRADGAFLVADPSGNRVLLRA
jgi:catechol 2,3-dioxygenase